MLHPTTAVRTDTAPSTPRMAPDPDCPSTGRHGTGTAYRWDRCRCPAARRAVRKWDTPTGIPRSVATGPVRDAITAIRAATGWTPEQFAQQAGVHRATLSRITAGTTGQYVTRRVAEAIAAVQQFVLGGCSVYPCTEPSASPRSPYCAGHRTAARRLTYRESARNRKAVA